MNDIRELTLRLENLERRYRKVQTSLVLIAVAASALMLMGQIRGEFPNGLPVQKRPEGPNAGQLPHQDKIRAEAFTLVDAKGAERASLVTDDGGSVFLVLFDKNGRPRADLQVNNDGPSLNFYDPNAKTRVAVGSTTLVASHVNVGGIIERNTPSSIVLFDAEGKLLWRTP